MQIPPTSDGYHLTRTLVSLPEKQPRWFEQVHWIHSASLFLEVPEGKYRRCVGPVMIANMLLDATGSIVLDEAGEQQEFCEITHDNIEDLLYWYSGMPLAPNSKPDAHHELTIMMRDYFFLNLLLSLIGYTLLNDPETRLVPKEIVPFTTENEGTARGGRSPKRPLTLDGPQLFMALPPFPIAEEDVEDDFLMDNIPFA
ncbi:hypothetical protein [Dictyobacter aurantiacus]|uniref:hypothetical protein n=1 Tax=Dictyobacter aurantiacus TaxID=1936993 RepID=UPI000F84E75C|nr:hypothetical protein [Dictyobacter aurantiacus]